MMAIKYCALQVVSQVDRICDWTTLWNEQQLRSLMEETVAKAYIYKIKHLTCLEDLASTLALIAFKWPHLAATSLEEIK